MPQSIVHTEKCQTKSINTYYSLTGNSRIGKTIGKASRYWLRGSEEKGLIIERGGGPFGDRGKVPYQD